MAPLAATFGLCELALRPMGRPAAALVLILLLTTSRAPHAVPVVLTVAYSSAAAQTNSTLLHVPFGPSGDVSLTSPVLL